MITKQWHAIYTKPRWEKKIADKLEASGIVSYCPLNKVQRRWSDRVKIVHEPLFKSYVFVYVDAEQMKEVRMVPGVVNFVYWNGLPAVIRMSEIDTIKKFLNEYEYVSAEPIRLMPNQRIKIMSGVLMDKEAVVIRMEKNKVLVMIEYLGLNLIATLRNTALEVI